MTRPTPAQELVSTRRVISGHLDRGCATVISQLPPVDISDRRHGHARRLWAPTATAGGKFLTTGTYDYRYV